MGLVSSVNGSFKSGRRSSSTKFGFKKNKLIVHYDASNSNSYGGSGSTFTDLSQHSNDGTIVGSPTFNTDKFTWTSGDYIRTPDLDDQITALSENHTVEIWCRPTNDGVVIQYAGQTTPNTSYHHSAIEIVEEQVEFGLWNGTALTSTGPTGAISMNEWHQIVLTYRNGTVKGYVDGELVGTASVAWVSPMDGGTGAFHIIAGAATITNQGDGTIFDGDIGALRVYRRALGINDIRRNYNHNKNTWSNPVAAWDPATDITTVAWIDASDSSNYSANGSNQLTSVTDKSGTYSNMTTLNGGIGGTPTVGNTLNSLNVFTFDGNNEYIQSTSYEAQVSSGNHWCIGLFRYDGTDNTKDSFWSYETNGSPKRDYAISSAENNNTWSGEIDMDGLSSNRISSTIGNQLSWTGLGGLNRYQWYIIAVFFNKTGNQIGIRFDGRTNSFSPVNDYDNSLQTNQELRIMRNRASVELEGQMAEFFAVADLPGTGGTDLSTIEKAEGYLAHKWGRTSALPVDHPYKSSAP